MTSYLHIERLSYPHLQGRLAETMERGCSESRRLQLQRKGTESGLDIRKLRCHFCVACARPEPEKFTWFTLVR